MTIAIIVLAFFFYFTEHKATLGILFSKIDGRLNNMTLTMQEKLK